MSGQTVALSKISQPKVMNTFYLIVFHSGYVVLTDSFKRVNIISVID